VAKAVNEMDHFSGVGARPNQLQAIHRWVGALRDRPMKCEFDPDDVCTGWYNSSYMCVSQICEAKVKAFRTTKSPPFFFFFFSGIKKVTTLLGQLCRRIQK
jgi:hypothetical protein